MTGQPVTGQPLAIRDWATRDWTHWGEDRDRLAHTSAAVNSGISRLLDGAKRVEDDIKRSKEHFAGQITLLCEVESVLNAMLKGRLRLHTLFYVSLSGTFQVFDLISHEFRSISN